MGKRLRTLTSGLVLLWAGAAWMLDLGMGAGFLVAGAIVLLGEVAGRFFGSGCRPFWLFVGAVFVIAGGGTLLGVEFQPIPSILIVAGLFLVIAAFRRHL